MATIATYAAFKHGQNIHQRSLIFGNHNDVLIHEEISSTSESEDDRRRLRIVQPITPVNLAGREHRPAPSQRKAEGEAEGYIVEFGSRKRAGARRRRRFVNDYFLEEPARHSLPDNLEEARAQWHALFAPQSQSVMQQLFEDEQAARAFDVFRSIGMDEEERLLSKLSPAHAPCEAPPAEEPVDKCAAASRFGQIPRQLRLQLRHAADSEVLQEMQDAVVRYLVSAAEREHDAKEPLEFVLDGSYERLLGHAVAMYYNLHSYSEDVKDGSSGRTERRTYMRCRKNSDFALPTVQLVPYLEHLISATGYFSYGTGANPKRQAPKKYRKHI
eukprot:EG_transcript_10154